MRYFTREWYRYIQSLVNVNDDDAQKCLFHKPINKYNEYLRNTYSRLSKDVIRLVELHLHDAHIFKHEIIADKINLFIEDNWARKKYNRRIEIVFYGVHKVMGFEDCEQQDIIYDEIFINSNRNYEYSALLDKSEITVNFHNVDIKISAIE
jgi:hypothetical protein